MKKGLLLSVLMWIFISAAQGQDQQYKPTWESLDSRPTPEWFKDAKFGIFIHWGLYSVPAWSPKGTYAEWYQYWLQTKSLSGNGDFSGKEVYNYHSSTYGPFFSYYDFAKRFKAELFDPGQWARLFEQAGAKYMVLTSKHHDGYALWPSKEAGQARDFPWNSAEVGPKRDLVGDLAKAVRKTDVKFGLYYSLYEWFHPWWQNDKQRYVNEHMIPQFKDLVRRYKPSVVWTDGGWDMKAERWKSRELLAWLYNKSPVGDSVVVNDRWGKETRHKHGGYYTTEYESGLEAGHPWEETRGMGFSFGYNRNEDIEDYSSAQALVLLLVDVVSRGGNLLLNIGPTGHGKIPVIMQERLLQMGEWLQINGEAIYGTRPWKKPYQWSEGKTEFKTEDQYSLGSDYILKQTVDPAQGQAVKEAFFTRKDNDLYVIVPSWPKEKLVVDSLTVSANASIQLLGSEKKPEWEQVNNKLVIYPPDLPVENNLSSYAYTFKISNFR